VRGKVIRRFKDKYTGVVYRPDDIYEHNKKERIEYLIGRGFLAVIGEELPEEIETKELKLDVEKPVKKKISKKNKS